MAAIAAAGLAAAVLAAAQDSPPEARSAQPAGNLAAAMASRLSNDLHVKTVVGKPVVAGAVTLIPILMVDVSFGGAAAKQSEAGGGFFMTGEARPLGFVAVTPKGTRFIGIAKAPAR